MRWIIDGADRDSGEDRTVLVHAETRGGAEQEAGRLGMLIGNVRADDPRRLPPLEELTSDPTGDNGALAQLAEEWTLPAVPSRDDEPPPFLGLLYTGRLLRVLAVLAYTLSACFGAFVIWRLLTRSSSHDPLRIFLALAPCLATITAGALIHALAEVALALRTIAQRNASPRSASDSGNE